MAHLGIAFEVLRAERREVVMEKRVLVVDDEEAIVIGLTMLFDIENLKADGAFDRIGATELLADQHYPVIVADLCLHTHEDGLGLVSDIKRLSPQSRVITISGYLTPELEEEVMRRG